MSAPSNSSDSSDNNDTFSTAATVEDFQICLILKDISLDRMPSEVEAVGGSPMFVNATARLPKCVDTHLPTRSAASNDTTPTRQKSITPADLEIFQYEWEIHTYEYQTNTRVDEAWMAWYQQLNNGVALATNAAGTADLASGAKVQFELPPHTKPKQEWEQDRKKEQDLDSASPVVVPLPMTPAGLVSTPVPAPAPKKAGRPKLKEVKAKRNTKPASKSRAKARPASQAPPKPASAVPEAGATPLVPLAQLAMKDASTVSPALEQPFRLLGGRRLRSLR